MSHEDYMAAQRRLANDLCAKSGQIAAYRTAAMTLRMLVERFGTPSPKQLEIAASEFERKADELNAEVLALAGIIGPRTF